MRAFRIPLFAGDLFLAALAIYLSFSVLFAQLALKEFFSVAQMDKIAVFVLVMLFSSFVAEIYSHERTVDRQEIGVRILFSLSFSFFILAVADLAFSSLVFEQKIIISSLFSFGFLQFLWHSLYRTWDRMSGFANRVMILGCGPLAQEMGGLLDTPNQNHRLIGFFNCSNKPVHVQEDKIVGQGMTGLFSTVKAQKANKVVVALTERRGVFPLQEILSCKLSGIEVLDAPTFYEQMTGKLLLESITPSWFIFSEGFKVTALRRILKRMLDVCCSLVGIIIVLPVLPIIALLIKIDSKGPVFFRQVRVGEGERDFTLIKFRTMRNDAESKSGAVWAGDHDPRITRVGSILRTCRIDEVPQLFNVLQGDMSFVGPRPERPEFVTMLKEVIPYYSERHYVKPGVTGWAQVSYPYGASVEDAIEKLRYDLYYIKNLSIFFDLFIILKTIHVVLFGKGGR